MSIVNNNQVKYLYIFLDADIFFLLPFKNLIYPLFLKVKIPAFFKENFILLCFQFFDWFS